MGSASTIQTAGPSVLLCYAIAGLVMFFIMRIMGEMLYLEPVTGSFAAYGYRYISPYYGISDRMVLLVSLGHSGTGRGHRSRNYVKYWFPMIEPGFQHFQHCALLLWRIFFL
mgnify:CR=1 FL=1